MNDLGGKGPQKIIWLKSPHFPKQNQIWCSFNDHYKCKKMFPNYFFLPLSWALKETK